MVKIQFLGRKCVAECWNVEMKLQFGAAMLKILKSLRDLDYPQLLSVYREQLGKSAVREAEVAFYEDLSLFFANKSNMCCLWAPQGRYTACVRVEPHSDGVLMTCLETAPECRRRGFAYALVNAVLQECSQEGCRCAYVHIVKNNHPSIHLHRKVGFRVVSDSARLVDGTVSQNYITMQMNLH